MLCDMLAFRIFGESIASVMRIEDEGEHVPDKVLVETLLVTWEQAADILGHRMNPVEMYPLRFHVGGKHTDEELDALRRVDVSEEWRIGTQGR